MLVPSDRPAPCLCLDLETARQDALILHEIGLYRPDLDVRLKLRGQDPDLVAKVNGPAAATTSTGSSTSP